ncbi:hypothetical protein HK101_001605 [Irineochytrium annulatum]|nr:hypothetical protein HK101_001605 [Irineochytrium annulatum]
MSDPTVFILSGDAFAGDTDDSLAAMTMWIKASNAGPICRAVKRLDVRHSNAQPDASPASFLQEPTFSIDGNSLFADGRLQTIMKSSGARHLSLAGFSASPAVDLTCREALKLGYDVNLIAATATGSAKITADIMWANLAKAGVAVKTVAEITGIVMPPSRGAVVQLDLGGVMSYHAPAGDLTFDSRLITDLLPASIAATAMSDLISQVQWQEMLHRGGPVPRRIAVEGDLSDGLIPIYRHPADTLPEVRTWSPIVDVIRQEVERALGGKQRMNHVLIQHYRNGEDYISEHSDKTLDVAQGTDIVNVSIGAMRVMTLREKRGFTKGSETTADAKLEPSLDSLAPTRATTSIPLPHNSLFVLGPNSNRRYLHSIRQDKRALTQKLPAEMDFAGERVSLTFRTIATFLTDDGRIFGQGATAKEREGARGVAKDEKGVEEMIRAFGRENQDKEFVWEEWYGKGFDVINCSVDASS